MMKQQDSPGKERNNLKTVCEPFVPGQKQTGIETKVVDVAEWSLDDMEELTKMLAAPAACLRAGGLVAFPTETVYGLGADAFNETAAKRIYAAKGRPSDNPLIVHIANVEDLEVLAVTNDMAYALARSFWPGPLTMILPKKEIVPYTTTGGLDTVAIRMPSHPAALALIQKSGVYVAAPSANTSGRPSPTKACHVAEDMEGKIEYIVDGGSVGIGIESSIVDLSGSEPTILRPGYITKSMLEQIIGTVHIDSALEKPLNGFLPKAPGMKYTHYAPKGEMTLVEAEHFGMTAGVRQQADGGESAELPECWQNSQQRVMDKIRELAEEKRKAGYRVGIMAPEETYSFYKGYADVVICVGERKKQNTVAAGLYAALRDFDAADVDYIYAESFCGEGLSYAIMNRLLKAAGQRIIRV